MTITSATMMMVMNHSFSGVPHFKSLRYVLLSPRTDLEKIKTADRMKHPTTQVKNENSEKKWPVPDDFEWRSLVIQKPFHAKSATSNNVARVLLISNLVPGDMRDR